MATLQKTRAKYSIEKSPKQTKKELYKYLDGFLFVWEYEIQDAIIEFLEIKRPSQAMLYFAGEMAREYMQNREYYLPLLDANE